MYNAQKISVETSAGTSIFKVPFKKAYPAYIVLVVGLALSVLAMNLVNYKVESDRQVEFDKSVSSVMGRLERGYANHSQVVKNLDGLFSASVQVVRDVFELYSTVPAKSNPAIMSIEYANFVREADVEQYVFYNRSERYYDYAVHPTGSRPLYAPISYVVPFEKNEHRSGFDLLSHPTWAEALNKSKSKKGIVCTSFFDARKDTLAFALVTSVVKKKESMTEDEAMFATAGDKFDGVIVVEINAKKFFNASLGEGVNTDKNIVFDVIETENDREHSVYSSSNKAELSAQYSPSIAVTKTLQFGDKTLLAKFGSAPSLTTGFQSYLGYATFAAGIVASVLAFLFITSMITSNVRAMDLADRITQSNRRILESTNDIISTFELSGVWKTCNPAIVRILGYQPEEVEGKHISKFLVGDGVNEHLATLIEQAKEELPFEWDTQMKCADGTIRWISWNFTVSRTEEIVYSVARDVTEHKIAENQIRLKSKQVELAEQMALEANEYKSNFMVRLTDHIKDTLTDSLTQLHKISSNMDFGDTKQLEFLQLANGSTDQLYNIVNDMLDVAHDTKEGATAIRESVQLVNIIADAQTSLFKKLNGEKIVDIMYTGIRSEVKTKVSSAIVSHALENIFMALSEGEKYTRVQLFAQENPMEKVIEVQILSSNNEKVSKLVRRFKNSTQEMIAELEHDSDDILYKFSCAASSLRRNSATITVESLGDEGNAVLINLPMN